MHDAVYNASIVPPVPSDALSVLFRLGHLVYDPQYNNHPDFAAAVTHGAEWYKDNYDEEPFTFDDLIEHLRRELDIVEHEEENRLFVRLGEAPLSYAHCVGFTYGWLMALFQSRCAPAVGWLSALALAQYNEAKEGLQELTGLLERL